MNRLNECFHQAAARFPARPCLLVGGRLWRYEQLEAAQAQVRDALAGAALTRAPIGLFGEKSFGMFAALLGTMSSGNAYVPLGPREPLQRLASQVRKVGLSAVICSRERGVLLRSALGLPEATGLRISIGGEVLELVDLRSEANPFLDASGMAYLLFTSGSTGSPKAVPISHHNALSFVQAFTSVLPVEPSDRVLQAAELSFDLSVGEIFPTWYGGGCVAVPGADQKLALAGYCEAEQISIWSSVPTLAAALVAMRAAGGGRLRRLRRSLFCGEAMPVDLAETWRSCAPGAELVNLYGPTEATVCVTWFRYRGGLPKDLAVVPIGSPLPGVEVRIDPLDGSPDGRGELLLAGDQVAEPYGGGWYRTGDLVRPSPEHGLLFIGRRDQQVKVHGFRVDLLEVEGHLRTLHARGQVAVVPVAELDGRVSGIVAFIEGEHSASELKQACRQALPHYMVPRRIIRLEALPRTATGKLDRGRLAALL